MTKLTYEEDYICRPILSFVRKQWVMPTFIPIRRTIAETKLIIDSLNSNEVFDVNKLIYQCLCNKILMETVTKILLRKKIIYINSLGMIQHELGEYRYNAAFANIRTLFQNYCYIEADEVLEMAKKTKDEGFYNFCITINSPTNKDKGKIWSKNLKNFKEGRMFFKQSINSRNKEGIKVVLCIAGIILSGLATRYATILHNGSIQRYEDNLKILRQQRNIMKEERKALFKNNGFGEF